MHPALSVILFTTASGGGYFLLALFGLFGALGILHPDPALGIVGLGLGMAAVIVGLVASAFHLGHPERAWRAFSQWRSSWLSREAVLSVATFVPASIFAFGWIFLGGIWPIAGFALAILSIATICATAMIYASLKPVRAWNNGWTLAGYLMLGLATGATWAAFITSIWSYRATLLLMPIAVCALSAGGLLKMAYWRSIDRKGIAGTSESATGLGDLGRVRPLFAPHTEDNYLMKEMGFQIGRKHAKALRRLALLVGFIGPALLIMAASFVASPTDSLLILAAAVGNFAGTLTERWLFFAEARHSVTLYYRDAAASDVTSAPPSKPSHRPRSR